MSRRRWLKPKRRAPVELQSDCMNNQLSARHNWHTAGPAHRTGLTISIRRDQSARSDGYLDMSLLAILAAIAGFAVELSLLHD